jgi:hypothetical protein
VEKKRVDTFGASLKKVAGHRPFTSAGPT